MFDFLQLFIFNKTLWALRRVFLEKLIYSTMDYLQFFFVEYENKKMKFVNHKSFRISKYYWENFVNVENYFLVKQSIVECYRLYLFVFFFWNINLKKRNLNFEDLFLLWNTNSLINYSYSKLQERQYPWSISIFIIVFAYCIIYVYYKTNTISNYKKWSRSYHLFYYITRS